MRLTTFGILFATAATTANAQVTARSVTGTGQAYSAQLLVRYQGEFQRQTGTLLGGTGSARLGAFTLVVGGFVGKLSPDYPTLTNPARTVRATSVALFVHTGAILALGVQAEARRYETETGISWVRLIGPSANITLPLGISGLTGGASVEYLPVASVSGADTVDTAVRGTFGLTYVPPGLPFVIQAAYRIERYDFAASASQPSPPPRLEQLDGLLVGAGFRIGR